MRVCASCKTRYQKGSGVTFHKFPTDSTQKQWLINMKVVNWIPNRHDQLCSKHFREDCFIRHVSRTILIKGSVPTIFNDVVLPKESKEVTAELLNYNECQEDPVEIFLEERREVKAELPNHDSQEYQDNIFPEERKLKTELYDYDFQEDQFDIFNEERREVKTELLNHESQEYQVNIFPDERRKVKTEMFNYECQEDQVDIFPEKRRKLNTKLFNYECQDDAVDIFPEKKRKVKTELFMYECQENKDDDIHLEELAMLDPNTSSSRVCNDAPTLNRTVALICKNIKHDHHYENTRSSEEVLQKVKKALRKSQTRVKTLSQHVKRMKISITSLKRVIKELRKKQY